MVTEVLQSQREGFSRTSRFRESQMVITMCPQTFILRVPPNLIPLAPFPQAGPLSPPPVVIGCLPGGLGLVPRAADSASRSSILLAQDLEGESRAGEGATPVIIKLIGLKLAISLVELGTILVWDT